MSQVTIKIGALSGVTGGQTVHVSGKLDETNVDEESKQIYAAIEKAGKGPKFLFDLKGLSYMNSKSVGYLADWHGKIQKAGGKMAIINAAENIMDILKVVGLDNLIDVVDSMEEAKKVLK